MLASYIVFEHFDSLPPLDQARHLYIMSVISNYDCMQKDFLGHGGEHISKNIFSISYNFNRRNGVFNQYL